MRREGFTLPELMISMAILAILSMFLSDMLVQQNKAYTVVDQVSEVQNNSAAIATLLEHDSCPRLRRSVGSTATQPPTSST